MKRGVMAAVAAALIAGCAGQAMRAPMKEVAESRLPVAGLVETSRTPRRQRAAVPAEVVLWVDCGPARLGAYTVDVRFDRRVVRLAAVDGTGPGGIMAPIHHRGALDTGMARLVAFHADAGRPMPAGRVPVAVLRFAPVSAGESLVEVRVVSLYDAGARPIRGKVSLSADTVTVEGR